jgi:hypothetical protein
MPIEISVVYYSSSLLDIHLMQEFYYIGNTSLEKLEYGDTMERIKHIVLKCTRRARGERKDASHGIGDRARSPAAIAFPMLAIKSRLPLTTYT